MKEGKDLLRNLIRKYIKNYHSNFEILYNLDDYTTDWSGYGLRFY